MASATASQLLKAHDLASLKAFQEQRLPILLVFSSVQLKGRVLFVTTDELAKNGWMDGWMDEIWAF
jgi:uncharacterized protein YjlB